MKNRKKISSEGRTGMVGRHSQWRPARLWVWVPPATIAACVTCPRLPLACFVAQSPLSPLTHSHTIAALWTYTPKDPVPIFSSTPTPPHLPTSKPTSLCSVVDISAVTLNLSSTPDLHARLTGEPCSSLGHALHVPFCHSGSSCRPSSPRHYTHTNGALERNSECALRNRIA